MRNFLKKIVCILVFCSAAIGSAYALSLKYDFAVPLKNVDPISMKLLDSTTLNVYCSYVYCEKKDQYGNNNKCPAGSKDKTSGILDCGSISGNPIVLELMYGKVPLLMTDLLLPPEGSTINLNVAGGITSITYGKSYITAVNTLS